MNHFAAWERRLGERMHEAADRTTDAADHDELHAAAALLLHDESERGKDYVGRWLIALAKRHGVLDEPPKVAP